MLKKFIAITISLLMMISLFSYSLVIAKEATHSCNEPDCMICITIHEAKQTIRTVHLALIHEATSFIVPFLFLSLYITLFSFFIDHNTLIQQKIRLND